MGSATDDKSGILRHASARRGTHNPSNITFDKLDYSQRLYGKIRLQAVRKNFSKGKIRNILGHDPDPRFFTSHSQKYGITVEEGNYSVSQRQMELQQLIHFKELGMGIADKSILRAVFITNKRQVIADMEEQNQQQAQQAQAQAQQQQQLDQSKVMQAMAKAKLDEAKIAETYAKIDEIEAGAEHKRTSSDLEIVKQMVELEDMDLADFRARPRNGRNY